MTNSDSNSYASRIAGRTTQLLAIAVGLFGVAVGTVAAHPSGTADGGWMGGWGSGWGMFGGWGFLWLLLLIGLVAFGVYLAGTAGTDRDSTREQPDRALAELRERYARGEIDDEEFEERRQRLQRRW